VHEHAASRHHLALAPVAHLAASGVDHLDSSDRGEDRHGVWLAHELPIGAVEVVPIDSAAVRAAPALLFGDLF
jgi:hypothetical protein